MTHKSSTPPAAKAGQFRRFRARILDAVRHDPYEPRGKLAAAHCGTCGAVYQSGRWNWSSESSGVRATCPACRRIADRLPAGYLTLEGPYVAAHRDELMHIARHEADGERAEHPMHRIMDVESGGDRVDITTTDIHLPRRIGTALKRAHDGTLSIDFGENEYVVRVAWRR